MYVNENKIVKLQSNKNYDAKITNLRLTVVFATTSDNIVHFIENEIVGGHQKFRVSLHLISHLHQTLPNRQQMLLFWSLTTTVLVRLCGDSQWLLNVDERNCSCSQTYRCVTIYRCVWLR